MANPCYTNLMLSQRARQPVHISWLVAVLCLGILVGVLVSAPANLSVYSWQWLAVAGLMAGLSFSKQKVYVVPLILIAGGLVGLWRGNNYLQELNPYQELIGQTLTIKGKVKEDSDVGKNGEVVLRLGDLSVEGGGVAGSIWISSSDDAKIKRGDIVTVRGRVAEGFGSFAASMHRAELVGIERPVPGDVALRARDWFADGVRQAVPEPEASLGVGYIVGQRRSLPEELDKALRATGLTHVVVASGYNLTILVSVSRRLFSKVSKYLAAFFSGGLTIGFMAVTGMSPSMSRAGLVTGLGLLAWYYGRRFHPLALLPLAAAVTLLISPSYGQNDLGWQLSFASFAGVLVVGPLLQNYLFGDDSPGVVRQVFFETLSAWLCTVPLIVMAFGQLSNVAIVANLLVLPLVPLAMLLTFIAGVVALIFPPLAVVAGLPATLVLGYMTKVTIYLGDVSWAQTEVNMTPAILAIYYAVLIGVCLFMWRKTRFKFVEGPTKQVI